MLPSSTGPDRENGACTTRAPEHAAATSCLNRELWVGARARTLARRYCARVTTGDQFRRETERSARPMSRPRMPVSDSGTDERASLALSDHPTASERA